MLNSLLLIGLFAPLLGFLILLTMHLWVNRTTTYLIGCSTIFLSFICFCTLFYIYTQDNLNPLTFVYFNWIPVENIHADFALYLDPTSLFMTLIITGVGFLIHLYSIGYMGHDRDYVRFFACMNFFVFAMLTLVLAANLPLLFVGWEGVGLASYLLIGFWYERPSAAAAATKAFVVNRIGDLGLLLGLLLTFYLFQTGDIAEVNRQAQQNFSVGSTMLTVLTLLYFVGAIGKSAQLPLHVWLPDAMEGPTPVSALIHAATMVTAGVYLLVRMHPVLELAPYTMYVVGIVGAVTSLFASLCAVAQTDLKRVLAYSTVSQLGLMFLACGVGAFYAAMFHLMTHAFMKALLFLSAGNVVHMLHDTTDMGKMGGLSKKLSKTNVLFLIGTLAMSGIPPLAAFFSKDLLLEQAHMMGYYLLFYLGLFASILTAFYLTRAYYLTFKGKPKLPQEVFEHIHEAPSIMILPVSVLAFLSIVGGLIGFSFKKIAPLQSFLAKAGVTLAEAMPNAMAFFTSPQTILSVAGAFLGLGVAFYLYSRYSEKLGPTIQFLLKSFYIDEIYDFIFTRPLKAISHLISGVLEPKVVDGSIHGTVIVTQKAAKLFQKIQSGQIRSYVAWMALGMGFLIVYLVA